MGTKLTSLQHVKRIEGALLAWFPIWGLMAGWCVSSQAALTFQFANSFSGTPPSTQTPWMSVVLSQSALNQVELTILLPGSLPAGTFLDSLYLNYDPNQNASLLTVTGPGISGKSGGTVSWNAGNNAFKADGDGFYDLILSFPTAHGAQYMVSAPDTVCYFINGPGGGNITPDCFLYTSVNGAKGAWYMAGHIQGYGNSAWVAAPEPDGFALLSGLALVGLGGFPFIFKRRLHRGSAS